MRVTEFWVGKQYTQESASSTSIPPKIVQLIHQGIAFNTREFEFSGGSCSAERAILSWAAMDVEKTKKSCAVLLEADSQKNRSGVLVGRSNDDSVHVHWKGEAELILSMCSSYYDIYGAVKDLGEDERKKLEQMIRGMAATNLGCIGFAHKQVPEEEYDDSNEKMKRLDPVRATGFAGMNICYCYYLLFKAQNNYIFNNDI